MNDEKKASMSTSQLRAWVFDLAQCAALLRVASDLDSMRGRAIINRLSLSTSCSCKIQIIERSFFKYSISSSCGLICIFV